MKKVLLLLMIAAFSASCTKTKDEIARDFIESKIKESMNDPESYEFASITPLDSVFSQFKDEPYAKEIRKEINRLDVKKGTYTLLSEDTYSNRSTFSKKQMEQFKDSVNHYQNAKSEKESEMAKLESEYTPRMEGYKTIFTFRGKNAFGAMIKNSYEITISENLDSILNMKIKEE